MNKLSAACKQLQTGRSIYPRRLDVCRGPVLIAGLLWALTSSAHSAPLTEAETNAMLEKGWTVIKPGKYKIGGPNWVIKSAKPAYKARGRFILHGPRYTNRWKSVTNNGKTTRTHVKIRPTVYFGATGGAFEIDAGRQEEDGDLGEKLGWHNFISISSRGMFRWLAEKTPSSYDPDFKQGDIEFVIKDDGKVILEFAGSPSKLRPLSADLTEVPGLVVGGYIASESNVRMKRVIGITKPVGPTLDFCGSYFKGTEFKDGRVASWGSNHERGAYAVNWPAAGAQTLEQPPPDANTE